MNETGNNPALNRLQAGVGAEELEKAVRLAGYLLQRVATELLGDSFNIAEEWGFRDRETNAHRSLDLFDFRNVRNSNRLRVYAALLVECKRSDLPFVFFEAAARRIPSDLPRVAGLRGRKPEVHERGGGLQIPTIATFLSLRDCAFVSGGSPMCSSFTKTERKGKKLNLSGSVPYHQVVMPLASATEPFAKLYNSIGSDSVVSACLAHPLCIVDGPMVLTKGGPKSTHLELCPWVRIILQEASREQHGGFWHHYVVDFVHRGYVSAFIDQHLLPFARQFADRAFSIEKLLANMKAEVPDLRSWKLSDLRPLTRAGPE